MAEANIVRYKATIAYDGSGFSGFQIQPNGRTVQEEIEKALKKSIKASSHGFILLEEQTQVFMQRIWYYTSTFQEKSRQMDCFEH